MSEMTREEETMLEECGHIHCPNPECGIHLSNGLSDFPGIVERTDSLEDACLAQGHEWACLGCGHEWGDEMTLDVAKERYKGEKRTYENKSQVSSACQVVHDLCNEMAGARRKDVIQAAVDKGIAFYTARTQYQKWFTAQKSAKGLATRKS